MPGRAMVTAPHKGDHGTVGKTQKEGMNWDVAELPVYAGTERKNSLVGGASLEATEFAAIVKATKA